MARTRNGRSVALSAKMPPLGDDVVHSTALVGVALASAILVLGAGVGGTIVRADNLDGERERRQPSTDVRKASQPLPPARVVLPAPWEPVVRPVTEHDERPAVRK